MALAAIRAYDLGILFGQFVQEGGKRLIAVPTPNINLIVTHSGLLPPCTFLSQIGLCRFSRLFYSLPGFEMAVMWVIGAGGIRDASIPNVTVGRVKPARFHTRSVYGRTRRDSQGRIAAAKFHRV
jgi:hypothetical protein